MGNIGASYKYLRESPCEANSVFFDLPSSFCAVFWEVRETLLFFGENWLEEVSGKRALSGCEFFSQSGCPQFRCRTAFKFWLRWRGVGCSFASVKKWRADFLFSGTVFPANFLPFLQDFQNWAGRFYVHQPFFGDFLTAIHVGLHRFLVKR